MRTIPFSLLKRTLMIVFLGLGCGLTASCYNTKLPPPLPEMHFTRYQPIYLDVGNVDIVDEYKSPEHPPYVEHLMPISPAEAMHIWVKDRLRAAGADKSLQIIIKDASVTSNEPPPAGLTDPPPNRLYKARLEVEMRVYGSDAMSEANIDVIAHQELSLSDSTSLEDRKRLYYRFIYDLMTQANAELEKEIFAYFPKYILYGKTP